MHQRAILKTQLKPCSSLENFKPAITVARTAFTHNLSKAVITIAIRLQYDDTTT